MSFQVPTGWQPSETTRAFAAGVAAGGVVDPDTELGKFREFGFDNPVANPDRLAVKWLERAVERGARKVPKQRSEGESEAVLAIDRLLRKIEDFRHSNPGDCARIEEFMAAHPWWNKSGRAFQIEQLEQAIRQRDLIFDFLEDAAAKGGRHLQVVPT